MKREMLQLRLELEAAKDAWGEQVDSENLENLIKRYGFSVRRQDLQIINGRCYVTHAGLMSPEPSVITSKGVFRTFGEGNPSLSAAPAQHRFN